MTNQKLVIPNSLIWYHNVLNVWTPCRAGTQGFISTDGWFIQLYCISNHFTTKKDWQSTFVFLFCIFSFFTSSKEIVCFIVWKMADPAWKEIIDSAAVFQVFRIEVRRIFMLYDWLPQIKSLLFDFRESILTIEGLDGKIFE